MQAVIVDEDPLTGEVRLRIQEAALELLAEHEASSLGGDPDRGGVPFVLAEEVYERLRTKDTSPPPPFEVHRALLEDSHFYERTRHGDSLVFLKLK